MLDIVDARCNHEVYSLECVYGHTGLDPRKVIISFDDLCDFGVWGVGLGSGLSEVRTSVMAKSGSCTVCTRTFAFALQLKKSR